MIVINPIVGVWGQIREENKTKAVMQMEKATKVQKKNSVKVKDRKNEKILNCIPFFENSKWI